MRTSVLINTRNQAQFLPDCLESALRQTRAADEIIVCDNGSTDGTAEVLRRYGGRIVALECGHDPAAPPAHNQAHAIAAAFQRTSGDIAFLLDGDDVFAPERIRRYGDAFAAPPWPVLVQSPMAWIDANGGTIPRLAEPFRHAADPLAEAYRRQEVDFLYPTSALAFRSDFLAHALPLDLSDGLSLWSDARLGIAALLKGAVVTLTEELGGWRRHSGSDSIRQASDPTYLARQAWRRTRFFNRCCRANGRRTICAWRSGRFYLRWLRAALPAPLRNRRAWRERT